MLSAEQITEFKRDGFLVIPNFLHEDETEALKIECNNLVEQMNPRDQHAIFTTGEKQKSENYFMTSGDKIRHFFEDGVLNEKGELLTDKKIALNKIGHALHWRNPVFKNMTFSPKIKDLMKSLGAIDPRVVQSMYIFKNAGTGGEVTAHQDATFLYTEPMKLVGLWFALEEATTENGCLYFVPKSHEGSLRSRWVRVRGDTMATIKLCNEPAYHPENFVAVPVPKGGCLVIDGLVVHKSGENKSRHSRPAYTFHVIDNHETEYSKDNWLQPTPELPFPSVYNTKP